tara:strand:+ start:49 stop:837 length:789 start_codon:yes stop_codon:yes gene_type:complete
MSRYYAQTEGHIMPTYRRGGGGRANLDGSVPVLGTIGSKAPEGYVQTGTTIKSNKAGERTFNIYTPADQVTQNNNNNNTDNNTDTNTGDGNNTDTGGDDTGGGGGGTTPDNPYQNEIDKLTTQIGTISGQIGGYTDTINTLRDQISSMQTDFGNQLKGIMDANTKALEDMSTQYQNELRQQQEAQEAARRQRELAAQTAAANQARAGQQADFQIGAPMMRGIFGGGLAGFKRRGKIKAQASGALAIAATEGQTKSQNKMLNV